LTRLSSELPGSAAATWQAPGLTLQLYRGVLCAVPCSPEQALLAAKVAALDLSVPGCYPMPGWDGHWLVEPATAHGVAATLLKAAQPAPRRGGERFSLAPGAVARSLKKQFQARGVPAWQRTGPLLFTGDGRLLWVPGLGFDGRLRAGAGEAQLQLSWQSDPRSPTAPRQRPG
jgi:tRNA(Ile)-lysidine synthase